MKNHSYTSESILLRISKGYSKIFNKWFMLLLLVVFAAACKKVVEEQGLVGICPEVISTDPVNLATGVALNKTVTATFNEAMNPSTINTSTFTIQQGTTAIAGAVTYTGMTATFSPTNSFTANTTYTGTITTGAKDPANNAMLSNYVWTFTTGDAPDVTPPTVISTDPIDAATGVLIDKIIAATFSEAMDPLTITTATFTIQDGVTPVLGIVAYAGATATFNPTADLAYNTTYTATITTGSTDLAGNAMVNNYVWTFTTEAATIIIPPTVISTDPINAATGVVITKTITATFSTPMDPLTINTTTFTLQNGVTPVSGSVTYTGTTASFNPTADLAYNTTYTATITTGSKDLAGNALVTDYVWSFTTMPQPVLLGSAAMFGAFGGSAGITNQGLNTVINNGSIGTTAASTLITGFHDMTGDKYTETPLNVGNVTGRIYTDAPPPVIFGPGGPFGGNAATKAIADQGQLDAQAAYLSISPASRPGGTDPGAGELGGLVLPPGVYKSAGATFDITLGNLTLDAMGDPNAQWIFQTAAGLTVGIAGPAGARSVLMINGGLPENVFWYVGSAATINAAGGGVMTGTIISTSGVTFSTAGNAAQTVLNGRAISLVASVTMVNTTINVP